MTGRSDMQLLNETTDAVATGSDSESSGGDQGQTTYRLEVRGSNGININTSSSGLSGGQRSVVLRADGDKQWIDTYGVFKRNRNSVGENITVNNGDNCMSAGPISINNGNTVTIADGGSWSIV